jgi:hypothetical protein
MDTFINFFFFCKQIIEDIFETTCKILISNDYTLNKYSYSVILLIYLCLFYIIVYKIYSLVLYCFKDNKYTIKDDFNQVKNDLYNILKITQELHNDIFYKFN